jgi:hypothetical protein
MIENIELLNLNRKINVDIVMPPIKFSPQLRQSYFEYETLIITFRELMSSIEFPSQLRQLYFENMTLNGSLNELMIEVKNARNRMIFVSTKINKLLRQKINIYDPCVNITIKSQTEENISEPQYHLRYLISENQKLTQFLRELMREVNNIRYRIMFVSIKINNLLREVIEEHDKVKLKKNSSVKTIKELYSTMERHCLICLEEHQYVDICTLPCNHEYGTKCFENWFSKGVKTCPECRNPTKEIKTYCFRDENN